MKTLGFIRSYDNTHQYFRVDHLSLLRKDVEYVARMKKAREKNDLTTESKLRENLQFEDIYNEY